MEDTTTVLEPQPIAPGTAPEYSFCPPPCPSPIGLVLFGVGRWGTHLLRNFLAQPQARVMAIVEPCLERLNTLPQRFDLSADTVLTPDWEMALQLPGVEAVAIATPAATHYPLIRSALQQKLHVLAEKPLTLDPTESWELCYLATQQQRQLIVDHTYLFHPAIQRGNAIIQQGQLGNLRYGYAARTHLGPVRQDVDALWDLAIHDIAIFNHWLQETPVQVQAQGTHWLQPDAATGLSDTGLSDLVWVTLTYPSGFQAFIHLCWANSDKQRRLSVVGSQGTLVFDELAAAPLMLLRGKLEPVHHQFVPLDQQHQALDIEPIEPLHHVCSHFLSCIQQNTPSWISPGCLGAELVEILFALNRSLHNQGKPVRIKDRDERSTSASV